jgi:hypothetical protein
MASAQRAKPKEKDTLPVFLYALLRAPQACCLERLKHAAEQGWKEEESVEGVFLLKRFCFMFHHMTIFSTNTSFN